MQCHVVLSFRVFSVSFVFSVSLLIGVDTQDEKTEQDVETDRTPGKQDHTPSGGGSEGRRERDKYYIS